MPVTSKVFDEKANVKVYTLSNEKGDLEIDVLDYGATIKSIRVPDKNGKVRDVVLGFDTFDEYQSKNVDNPYFGATVGRVANRIRHGKFTLNGVEHQLDCNSNGHHLHGGRRGFDKCMWDAKVDPNKPNSLELNLVSPDGDQKYPGWLSVKLVYTVTDDRKLTLDYEAKLIGVSTPDSDTIVNLTNHSYFNLNGAGPEPEAATIKNHEVKMTNEAKWVCEVRSDLTTTGYLLRTEDAYQGAMDFTGKFHNLGERISQIVDVKGFDHCYVLDPVSEHYDIQGEGNLGEDVVTIRSPLTGIEMSMSTTEPGFQLYTGQLLPEVGLRGKASQSKAQLGLYSALCLEAQRFPDAINHERWQAQVILRDGETYKQKTVYSFSTSK